MAEISTSAGNNRHGGSVHKRKQLSTKVDLTPMVDLGFLLITFFIITTTWSEPKSMTFLNPADGPPTPYGETSTLTIITCNNNRIFYYHGKLHEALKNGSYGFTNYHIMQGIGNIIRKKQVEMDRFKKDYRNDLILIIHPTTQSTYQNIVSVLDEVLINDVRHYAMVDLDESEKVMLANYKIEL